MTITVVSGLPGHGKTLFTLTHVEALRKETGRNVYVHGVVDLALPWQPLEDPRKWDELPDGAIVVVDEAWKFFPKRSPGALVPKYIEAMATHRHRGFDIYLVSQSAGLQLDHFVRGLVGEHFHVRRVFGSRKARLSRWEALHNPDDYHDRKKAVQSWFAYPKAAFGWYKSAEVHTIKTKLPWKIIIPAALGVVAIPILIVGLLHGLRHSAEAGKGTSDSELAAGPLPGGRVSDVKSFRASAASFTEAVPGIPYTAPVYAAGVRIDDAPKVSGCGVLKIGHLSTCKCTDQQGNTLELDKRLCMAYFQRGSFDPAGKLRYPVIEPYVPPLPGNDWQAQGQPAAGGATAPPPRPSTPTVSSGVSGSLADGGA